MAAASTYTEICARTAPGCGDRWDSDGGLSTDPDRGVQFGPLGCFNGCTLTNGGSDAHGCCFARLRDVAGWVWR